jgi:hypothetical protein
MHLQSALDFTSSNATRSQEIEEKMPKYFPQHFKQKRGYSKAVTSDLVGARLKGAKFLETRDAAAEMIVCEYVAKTTGIKTAKKERAYLDGYLKLVANGTLVTEGLGALNHMEFELNKSVIFDVNQSLVAELKDTDASELTINDVDPPFPAFYINVGPQDDIVFNGSVKFEGAYIRTCGADWLITICGRREGCWWDEPSDWHTLRMTNETFALPLPQAIELALGIDRQELIDRHNETVTVIPQAAGLLKSILAKHDASTDALKKGLNLCVQVLAYIVSYHDDQKTGWQDDTPVKMREKADAALSPKERERNQSKLQSMGFWKVIKVGFEFGRAHLEAVRSGERVPHSRDPHWRRQRYGTGLAFTKLIHIGRTFVAGKAAKKLLGKDT